MKLQKQTIFVSLIICLISLVYSVSVEWEWGFFVFMPERISFFMILR